MIMLAVNRRAARAHHVFDVFASQILPGEFSDQLDRSRVARCGVAPRSSRSRWLAVDLIGDGAMDQVQVLLRQGDARSPGREQLGLSGASDHQPGEKGNNGFS